ncbi:MAG: hypothetical protein V3T24_02345 [Longimicrobiales bacterium]
MNREQLIWTIVFALGAIGLLIGAFNRVGSTYVQGTEREFRQVTVAPEVEGEEPKPKWVDMKTEEAQRLTPDPGVDPIRWTEYRSVIPAQRNDPGVVFSLPRTIGVWVAGLLTLFILSFLYRDNPLYKLAESIVVGSSAAYVMVTGFWTSIIGNLFAKLTPDMVRDWAQPGLSLEEKQDWVYIFPLILGILLLWRLAPKGAWISRWPLAFFIGATAGFRLTGYLEPDFVRQISSTIMPLYETTSGGSFDLWATVGNVTILVGILACLVYFFFSIEHKGFVGRTAKLGIWFLMITFGAGFGYTVMGRIALLAERFQFIFDDWLWLIDPTGKRLGM